MAKHMRLQHNMPTPQPGRGGNRKRKREEPAEPPEAPATPETPQTPSRQRPPLFTTAVLPDRADLSPSPLSTSSRSWTPLASPSLATYRAPEELEAGPSKLSGYFTQQQEGEEEYPAGDSGSTEREYETYFRVPEDEDADDAEPSTTSGKGKGKGKEPAVAAEPALERQDSESDHDMPGLMDAESEDGMELDEGRHVEVHIPEPDHFNPFDGEDEPAEADEEQLVDARGAEQRVDFPDPEDGDVGMEDDMEGALEGELTASSGYDVSLIYLRQLSDCVALYMQYYRT